MNRSLALRSTGRSRADGGERILALASIRKKASARRFASRRRCYGRTFSQCSGEPGRGQSIATSLPVVDSVT